MNPARKLLASLGFVASNLEVAVMTGEVQFMDKRGFDVIPENLPRDEKMVYRQPKPVEGHVS